MTTVESDNSVPLIQEFAKNRMARATEMTCCQRLITPLFIRPIYVHCDGWQVVESAHSLCNFNVRNLPTKLTVSHPNNSFLGSVLVNEPVLILTSFHNDITDEFPT